jgi:hypothetical protein
MIGPVHPSFECVAPFEVERLTGKSNIGAVPAFPNIIDQYEPKLAKEGRYHRAFGVPIAGLIGANSLAGMNVTIRNLNTEKKYKSDYHQIALLEVEASALGVVVHSTEEFPVWIDNYTDVDVKLPSKLYQRELESHRLSNALGDGEYESLRVDSSLTVCGLEFKNVIVSESETDNIFLGMSAIRQFSPMFSIPEDVKNSWLIKVAFHERDDDYVHDALFFRTFELFSTKSGYVVASVCQNHPLDTYLSKGDLIVSIGNTDARHLYGPDVKKLLLQTIANGGKIEVIHDFRPRTTTATEIVEVIPNEDWEGAFLKATN